VRKRKGGFHDPTVYSESGAVFGAATRDYRRDLDLEPADPVAVDRDRRDSLDRRNQPGDIAKSHFTEGLAHAAIEKDLRVAWFTCRRGVLSDHRHRCRI
jgi:hypothetical protein